MLRSALAALCVCFAFAVNGMPGPGDPGGSAAFVRLELDGVAPLLLTSCESFGSESEIIEVRISAPNGTEAIQKIPGRLKYLNVVCSAVLTTDKSLSNWRKQIENGQVGTARKNGSIVLLDATLNEVARYNFANGWPASLKVTWKGASSSDPVTETVSIVIEGLTRQ